MAYQYGGSTACSKRAKKPILIDFTGSDWCVWCFKLKEEVFSTAEFKKYANEKLVLLEIDFPKRKKQTQDQKKYNRTLTQKYGIEGFPTVFLVDATGKIMLKTGYLQGGPSTYIAHLEKAVNNS